MKKFFLLSFAIVCSLSFLQQQPTYNLVAQEKAEKTQPSAIIRRSEGVIRSTAINRAVPEYPLDAKEQKIEGDVVVEITISEEGNVVNARSMSGPQVFVQPTLEAVKKWTFKPTVIDGKAVKVSGVLSFRFKLESPFTTATSKNVEGDNPAPPPSIIRRSEGVLRGIATNRVNPEYPAEAKEQKVEGDVVVEITVDEEGKVVFARNVSGHKLLVKSAEDAVKQWTFKPTTLDGKGVKVAGVVTFRYLLGDKEE